MESLCLKKNKQKKVAIAQKQYKILKSKKYYKLYETDNIFNGQKQVTVHILYYLSNINGYKDNKYKII